MIIADNISLKGLYIGNQIEKIDYKNFTNEENVIIVQTKTWLEKYFRNEKPSINELNILPDGNEFRKTVWKLLCNIPYGKTKTYKEIAKEVSIILEKDNMSAQAVGNAIGNNPISIIIPCHRVVGKNGNLVGYSGGIDLKIKLLTHENMVLN